MDKRKKMKTYYLEMVLKSIEESEEWLKKLKDVEERKSPYDKLSLLERSLIKNEYTKYVKTAEEEAIEYDSYNFTDEMFDGIDHLFKVYDIDEKNQSHIIMAMMRLEDYYSLNIGIKRYDEIESKLNKNADEIINYGGSADVILPDKPGYTLNYCLSELERGGVSKDGAEAIVKYIDNRKKLPKGYKKHIEFDTEMDKSQKSFSEFVTYIGNGLMIIGKK